MPGASFCQEITRPRLQDKILHGRAALPRRPKTQGGTAALPCLKGDDSCRAANWKKVGKKGCQLTEEAAKSISLNRNRNLTRARYGKWSGQRPANLKPKATSQEHP
jgi:hypothetical protein